MKWRLLVLHLLASNYLISQPEIPSFWNQQAMLDANQELINVQGTPYLFEEFKPGEIYYDGEHKIELPLRLDLYRDRLEYQDEDSTTMVFLNQDEIDYVSIENDVFVYLPQSRHYKVSGFLKMWNSRLPSLLTKMNIKYFKAEEAKPFDLHEPKPDRLERIMDNHYIMMSGEEVERVSSVKKLIKYLGAHSAELTEYAKKTDLSSNDPNDMAKLVNYYLQLEQAH
jgi:hypothetical protein